MNYSTNGVVSKLQAALDYAAKGYRVLRVYGVTNGVCNCRKRGQCRTPGKHPVGRNWQHQATTDQDVIRKWFAQRNDYNLGILTGAEAGIIVLDVDPRHGGKESLAELSELVPAMQPTPQQDTSHDGWHLVFAHPGGTVATRAGVRPGIDIRADGNGMFVVWPSQHYSGALYHWRENCSLLEVAPPPFPPEWLFLLEPSYRLQGCNPEHAETQSTQGTQDIQGKDSRATPSLSKRASDGVVPSEEEIIGIIHRSLPTAIGTRHDRLFQLTRELVGAFGSDPMPFIQLIASIVTQWYEIAVRRGLSSGVHSKEECVERVLDSWDDVRVPAGEDTVHMAMQSALRDPPHDVCTRLPVATEPAKVLVGACAILAAQNGGRFFLSRGKAADELSRVLERPITKYDTQRAFKRLEKYGILRVITPGGNHTGSQATEFEFIA